MPMAILPDAVWICEGESAALLHANHDRTGARVHGWGCRCPST